MNNSIRIVLSKVTLKCPVMGEAERDQCVCCHYCIEGDDISAIVFAADARKRIAGYRLEIREPNWIASLGSRF